MKFTPEENILKNKYIKEIVAGFYCLEDECDYSEDKIIAKLNKELHKLTNVIIEGSEYEDAYHEAVKMTLIIQERLSCDSYPKYEEELAKRKET